MSDHTCYSRNHSAKCVGNAKLVPANRAERAELRRIMAAEAVEYDHQPGEAGDEVESAKPKNFVADYAVDIFGTGVATNPVLHGTGSEDSDLDGSRGSAAEHDSHRSTTDRRVTARQTASHATDGGQHTYAIETRAADTPGVRIATREHEPKVDERKETPWKDKQTLLWHGYSWPREKEAKAILATAARATRGFSKMDDATVALVHKAQAGDLNALESVWQWSRENETANQFKARANALDLPTNRPRSRKPNDKVTASALRHRRKVERDNQDFGN